MYRLKTLVIVMLLAACFSTAAAQGEQCSPLVTAALQTVQEACADTHRNQACYGNDVLQVQFQPGFSTVPFAEPGDVVDVTGLRTLQSSSANPSDTVWGIALMRLQANLPDTLPGQTVTMIVMGGTQIENAIAANPNPTRVQFAAASDSVVRGSPMADGQIVGVLVTDDTASVLGKSPDGLWLRVELADRDQRLGWIPAAGATVDIAALPVIDPNLPTFSPMQAFYLRPQFSSLQCSDAPNGLLVQSPENVTVQITVNEVQFQLGSTVFFQLGGDGSLSANVLEGNIQAQAGGVTVSVPTGYRTRIPLDASQRPVGIPSAAEPYDAGALTALPLGLLPVAVNSASTTWVIGQSLCVNNLNGAWLRGAPSSENQAVVRVLQNGTPVAVADAPQFDGAQSWWPLRTGNNTGWIEQSNLTACDQPVPPPCTPRTDWLFAYTVQPGDTLSRIAEAAGLTVTELINGNCLEAPYNLALGTVLRVPRTPVFITATPTSLPTLLPVRTPEVIPTRGPNDPAGVPTNPPTSN